MKYKVHPVAEMFPLIPENSREWNLLIESIEANGQIEPCVVDGDILLDGRNRLRVCERLNRAPYIVQWKVLGVSVDQGEWIAAKNLSRRHLTDDQKAQIAFDVDKWQAQQAAAAAQKKTRFAEGNRANPGGKPKAAVQVSSPAPQSKSRTSRNHTRAAVAAKANVSEHKVMQAAKIAKAVADGVIPSSVEADVKNGKIKLSAAIKLVPRKQAVRSLRARVESALRSLLKKFGSTEHDQVKQILREILL